MALSTEKKNEIVKEFRLSDKDTGSPEVQVALLSQNMLKGEEMTKFISRSLEMI